MCIYCFLGNFTLRFYYTLLTKIYFGSFLTFYDLFPTSNSIITSIILLHDYNYILKILLTAPKICEKLFIPIIWREHRLI